MNFRLIAATAVALGLVSAATTASAVVVVLPNVVNQLNTATGQTILWDFDGLEAANTDYDGNVRSFPGPGSVTNSAPPPWDPGPLLCCANGLPYNADNTNYGSVQGGPAVATFSTQNGWYLTAFSFYMGSPDLYNSLRFNFLGGGTQLFAGDAIWGGAGPSGQPGNGDRTKGFRVYYDFGGAKVTSIEFGSNPSDAFEFDSLAGVMAVPEPSTWTMMILGFGSAGAMLRSSRRRRAVATA